MPKKQETKVSITLANRKSRDFDLSLLNSYALKKYKTLYEESKTEVNADIKALSEKYHTVVSTDIRMLLVAELLPIKDKKKIIEIHKKEITEFI